MEGVNKSETKHLLSVATQESHFIFNDVFYNEKNGVAMTLLLRHWTYVIL